MKQKGKFDEKLRNRPFSGYEEYMDYIFACANLRLQDYIQGLKEKYANGQGNYKNALYAAVFQIVNENGSITTPTIESASRLYFG